MFRSVAAQVGKILRESLQLNVARTSGTGGIRFSHGASNMGEHEFHEMYLDRINSDSLDGWEMRQIMNELLGMDLVPEPEIIIAALHGCRKLNDYALATRWLEGCRGKCGDQLEAIYPYLMTQIKPTLDELGVSSVEEMGYNYPQLWLETIFHE